MDDPTESYDEMAPEYAGSNPHSPARAGYEWPAVKEVLPDVEGKRVIDAGCGTGHYSDWLAKQGAAVVGVDGSEGMVAQARKRHGDAAEFHVADLREGLPFEHGAFEVVLCQLTLEHVREWAPVFEEFARVLAPGGQVVVSTDHPFTTYHVVENEPPEIGNAEAESADYYEREAYGKTWGAGDAEVRTRWYRRPLQAVLEPAFEAGLVLTELREPKPVADAEFLEYFEENTPRFLVFRARKPTTR